MSTEQPQNQARTNNRNNPEAGAALRAIDRLEATLREPPTFKEVAKHELQRAAVWAPMLLATGVALLWTQKKFFISLVVPVGPE